MILARTDSRARLPREFCLVKLPRKAHQIRLSRHSGTRLGVTIDGTQLDCYSVHSNPAQRNLPYGGPHSLRSWGPAAASANSTQPSRLHRAGARTTLPIDLQIIDNPLDTLKVAKGLLRHLLLVIRTNTPLKNNGAAFFMAENLMTRKVRISLESGIEALNSACVSVRAGVVESEEAEATGCSSILAAISHAEGPTTNWYIGSLKARIEKLMRI